MANRQSIKNHTKLLFKPNKRHSQIGQYQDKLLNHLSTVPIFYLSDYRYGGCTTFTAHLICLLQKKHVFYLTQDFEKEKGNFGYGIRYQKKPLQFQDNVKFLLRKCIEISIEFQNWKIKTLRLSVSISRIEPHKNIDMMLKANKN